MFRFNFRPHQSRHQDIYANLKDFLLNNKEKIWLAEAVCCEHGAEWHISAAECERRYSIPAATVSQWVHKLHYGIEKHLEAIFWWIFDSTQFLCEMDAVETHLLEGDATRNPLTVVGESALAICIMWTHLCNASGETALPIRLISMEELDEVILCLHGDWTVPWTHDMCGCICLLYSRKCSLLFLVLSIISSWKCSC